MGMFLLSNSWYLWWPLPFPKAAGAFGKRLMAGGRSGDIHPVFMGFYRQQRCNRGFNSGIPACQAHRRWVDDGHRQSPDKAFLLCGYLDVSRAILLKVHGSNNFSSTIVSNLIHPRGPLADSERRGIQHSNYEGLVMDVLGLFNIILVRHR